MVRNREGYEWIKIMIVIFENLDGGVYISVGMIF